MHTCGDVRSLLAAIIFSAYTMSLRNTSVSGLTFKESGAATPAEGQVLLGKELGIKRAIEVLKEVRTDRQFA